MGKPTAQLKSKVKLSKQLQSELDMPRDLDYILEFKDEKGLPVYERNNMSSMNNNMKSPLPDYPQWTLAQMLSYATNGFGTPKKNKFIISVLGAFPGLRPYVDGISAEAQDGNYEVERSAADVGDAAWLERLRQQDDKYIWIGAIVDVSNLKIGVLEEIIKKNNIPKFKSGENDVLNLKILIPSMYDIGLYRNAARRLMNKFYQ